MSAKCEGYQPHGEDIDIKYRVSGHVVWVRILRQALADYYELSNGSREKFVEEAEAICERIGADIAARDAKGERHALRHMIKSEEFARIMKAA